MTQDDEFLDYVLDQLAGLGGVAARRMFGGYGLFRDGAMFGLISGDALYFKAGAANRADFEAAGAAPFSYARKGRRIALAYRAVPADVLDDADSLCIWARKACEAARAARSSPG
ncbi:MAG: TfoX/Sxy family protein [Alphaproteobacteria bacterium]